MVSDVHYPEKKRFGAGYYLYKTQLILNKGGAITGSPEGASIYAKMASWLFLTAVYT